MKTDTVNADRIMWPIYRILCVIQRIGQNSLQTVLYDCLIHLTKSFQVGFLP